MSKTTKEVKLVRTKGCARFEPAGKIMYVH